MFHIPRSSVYWRSKLETMIVIEFEPGMNIFFDSDVATRSPKLPASCSICSVILYLITVKRSLHTSYLLTYSSMAKVETVVFLSLILDLFAFTIPLPLFPRLIEWYTVVSMRWQLLFSAHTADCCQFIRRGRVQTRTGFFR